MKTIKKYINNLQCHFFCCCLTFSSYTLVAQEQLNPYIAPDEFDRSFDSELFNEPDLDDMQEMEPAIQDPNLEALFTIDEWNSGTASEEAEEEEVMDIDDFEGWEAANRLQAPLTHAGDRHSKHTILHERHRLCEDDAALLTQLMHLSATNKDTSAQYYLGEAYFYGWGTSQSDEKALYHFKQAQAQGYNVSFYLNQLKEQELQI